MSWSKKEMLAITKPSFKLPCIIFSNFNKFPPTLCFLLALHSWRGMQHHHLQTPIFERGVGFKFPGRSLGPSCVMKYLPHSALSWSPSFAQAASSCYIECALNLNLNCSPPSESPYRLNLLKSAILSSLHIIPLISPVSTHMFLPSGRFPCLPYWPSVALLYFRVCLHNSAHI